MVRRKKQDGIEKFFTIIIIVLFGLGIIWTFVPHIFIYGFIILIIIVVVFVYRKKGFEPFKLIGNTAKNVYDKIEIEDESEEGHKYPPLTQTQKEEAIRKVGTKCCYPGCQERESLDVHHINPRRESGNNKENNLIVLCPTHHRKADRGSIPRERLKQYSVSKMKR